VLFKKFPAFYGARKFNTAFTRTRQLSISWARSIHSMPPPHFLKIHFNITLPCTVGSSKWSSLKSTRQNPLPHTCYIPCPSHSSWFYRLNNIWCGILLQSSSLCSLLHSPVSSPLLGPNILLSTLFSNTLSLCSSLNVSDQVRHPYKKGKIIVLCILVFIFLDVNKFMFYAAIVSCTPQGQNWKNMGNNYEKLNAAPAPPPPPPLPSPPPITVFYTFIYFSHFKMYLRVFHPQLN